MIDQLTSTQHLRTIAAFSGNSRPRQATQSTGKGDVVSFSPEAYAALREMQTQKQQAKASTPSTEAVFNRDMEAVAEDIAAAQTEKKDKSLLDALREYIKNPTLKHAMDKMERVVQSMGLGAEQSKAVLDEIQAAFRSGIPAKGEQTADVMTELTKSIKKATGLPDADIARLMEKIELVVADAQKKIEDETDSQQDAALA